MTREVSAGRGGARLLWLHWALSTAKLRLLSLLNEDPKRCLVCFVVPDPVDSSNPGVDIRSEKRPNCFSIGGKFITFASAPGSLLGSAAHVASAGPTQMGQIWKAFQRCR